MTLLRIEKNNGIAIVSLNRPDKRNAMSFALLKELVRTAEKLKKDRSLRCVILTGEANVFSAGIDLADLNNPQNRAFAQACNWRWLPTFVLRILTHKCRSWKAAGA